MTLMDATTAKVPLRERVNLRMVVFVAAMLMLVGYPVYLGLESTLTGGIRQQGEYALVDLKAMSTFPFDSTNGTIEDVPDKWRALDGKKVILYGEMWQPQAAAGKLGNFELVYSIANCCFSGPPQIQHFVQASVKPGASQVGYFEGVVKVTGTLRVDVKKTEGKVSSVYQLEVDSVEPT